MTEWKTFGKAVFTQPRGASDDRAYASINSVTTDAHKLQVMVTDSRQQAARGTLYWSVRCWEVHNGESSIQIYGSVEAYLPIKRVIDEIDVARYDFCRMGADIGYDGFVTGRMKIVLHVKR